MTSFESKDSKVFTWDNQKLEKKVEEYIGKGYPLNKVFGQVICKWTKAVKDYFEASAERNLMEQEEAIIEDGFSSFPEYLDKSGLANVEVDDFYAAGVMKTTFKYRGSLCSISRNKYDVFYFYPYVYDNFQKFSIRLPSETPFSAIAGYLRVMPVTNRRVDEIVVKMIQIYDRKVIQQKEEFREDLAILEGLMKQSAGKPVGKLMKFIRWNLECGRPVPSRMPVDTIRIIGDSGFSFTATLAFSPALWASLNSSLRRSSEMTGVLMRTQKATEVECRVDKKCHNVYLCSLRDPDTQADTALRSPSSLTIQQFILDYFTEPILSIDYIDQKL